MRRAFLLSLSILLAAAALPARAQVSVSANVTVGGPVEVASFHERLGGYGHWTYVDGYGQVWAPNSMRAGWRPYSDGRWVLTEYGWTYVSDDPWGWAAYHYGNWVFAGGAGWVWIPGRVWAPAWVTWRYGGGYAAWAPAPPIGYGYRVRVVEYNSPGWVVVQEAHFTQPIATFAVSANLSAGYVARAQPLAAPVAVTGGVAVNPGPHPQAVAAAVGTSVQPVSANAVVSGGTRSIATAARAPSAPAPVAQAMQNHWNQPASSGGHALTAAQRQNTSATQLSQRADAAPATAAPSAAATKAGAPGGKPAAVGTQAAASASKPAGGQAGPSANQRVAGLHSAQTPADRAANREQRQQQHEQNRQQRQAANRAQQPAPHGAGHSKGAGKNRRR